MSLWWWMGGDNSGNTWIWGLGRKEIKNFDKRPQTNKSNEYLLSLLFHLTSQLLEPVKDPLLQIHSSFRVSETAHYFFFPPVRLLIIVLFKANFVSKSLCFKVSQDYVTEFFPLYLLLQWCSLHPSYTVCMPTDPICINLRLLFWNTDSYFQLSQ